ncbi:CoA transferase (plasmid) [Agrobacterium tumefaciens]|nr:CoA transferase [Agrobacterium tumefaciens]THD29929.1 MAG: CoA transferase [Flavobacterium johnsoniae]
MNFRGVNEMPVVPGALNGITVLELGMVMQVPLAGQMLSDLGARVIKVERLPPGEILRTLDPIALEQGGMSAYYAALGRNKESVSLDLKTAAGKDILMKMVESADVVLHNFRPGVMERLGFGYEELEKLNPRIVYAVGYAFGDVGPMAHMPGQDMLAQAYSGLARSGLSDDQKPNLANSPYIDYLTALTLTQGILAAIVERERSGKGQKVSTSLLATAVSAQILEAATLSMHGKRTSWSKQSILLPTSDGWVLILTLFRDNPLQGMCRAFDIEDLSKKEQFSTHALQVAGLQEIGSLLAPIVNNMATAECVSRLSKEDVLCSPVNTLEEAIDSEQVKQNEMLWDVDVPGYGSVRLVGNPLNLSRTPLRIATVPRHLGEDTQDVLRELGFPPETVEEFRSSGAVHY